MCKYVFSFKQNYSEYDCGQDSKSFGDDTSTVKDDVTVMC